MKEISEEVLPAVQPNLKTFQAYLNLKKNFEHEFYMASEVGVVVVPFWVPYGYLYKLVD